MGTPSSERLDRFVRSMQEALSEHGADNTGMPVERRRLSTVLAECGVRATTAALARIGNSLAEVGVYSEPPLSGDGLRRDDWILFSTGPLPPDSLLFAREADLARFFEACLGSGPFRLLRPYKEGRKNRSREFRLPSGNRIDLLCEESRRSGKGGLVAVELKRERQRGTIEQMVEYLDELRKLFPDREVRGLIITGREDRVGAALIHEAAGHAIDWFCYRVEFEKVASGGERLGT